MKVPSPAKPAIPPRTTGTTPVIKRINIALQGGGAHGAFSWGVLDRLLEDERIEIEAVSGTSAGAMNAVVMAEGLAEGGRARARAQLSEFWKAVADALAASSQISRTWAGFFPAWLGDVNPAVFALQAFAQSASPYLTNPLDYNPLRDIVKSEVDFDRVHACTAMKIFVAATNVETGRAEIFTGKRITLDSVMASACLPTLYKAVIIDGTPYWDGGYTANPPLDPLLTQTTSQDILVVQINPERRAGTPLLMHQILDRLNEITFNASLLDTIDQVALVNRQIRAGHLKDSTYRDIFLHRVGGGKNAEDWGVATKFNASWDFLQHLFDQGRTETDAWLKAHFDDIGHCDSMDTSPVRAR